MDNERPDKRFESVYSNKVKAGRRRTYFFDVRKTKGDDFYITLTESTLRFNGEGYERHKIFLYKEDFNRFISGLEDVINHVKTELMPDYDYDEFDRRHEAYEAERLAELKKEAEASKTEPVASDKDSSVVDEPPAKEEGEVKEETAKEEEEGGEPTSLESEEDMSW